MVRWWIVTVSKYPEIEHKNMGMGEKGDISDMQCGMLVGATHNHR